MEYRQGGLRGKGYKVEIQIIEKSVRNDTSLGKVFFPLHFYEMDGKRHTSRQEAEGGWRAQ